MDLEPTIFREEKMVCFASWLSAKCKPFAHSLKYLEFLLQVFYQTSSFLYNFWTLLSLYILASLIYLIWVDRKHVTWPSTTPKNSPGNLTTSTLCRWEDEWSECQVAHRRRNSKHCPEFRTAQIEKPIYGIMKLLLGTTPSRRLWSTPFVWAHFSTQLCYVVTTIGFVTSTKNASPTPKLSTKDTFPKTNIAPARKPSQKETIVFQPSIFMCDSLVSGRVLQLQSWVENTYLEAFSNHICHS